jgi:membrane fusion protein (multidrug efflux system)
MVAGDAATIKVDALPGVTLHGHLDSFAPGTQLAVLAAAVRARHGQFHQDRAAGAVRIRFDPGQSAVTRLRPGLSTPAMVRLTEARS